MPTDPKPIPQVPAALCGLFPGARVAMTSIPEMGAGTAGRRMEDGCWSVRFDTGDFGWWTPEVLSLLLDSPLSLCHAARWLAGRLGMDPGATAPLWYSEMYNKGSAEEVVVWVLRVFDRDGYAKTLLFIDAIPLEYMKAYTRSVPGISGMDPATALAAACVAVGGAK